MNERSATRDEISSAGLLTVVYAELRELAAARMAREAGGQTLQATALVHEAWLRLAKGGARFENRAHFFAAAAEAMRRILVDRARRKRAAKHGGGLERVNADAVEIAAGAKEDDLLSIDEALERLAKEDARMAELVKLRFFVGMTNREAAEALGVSEPTVERWWAFARAWLLREMTG